MTEGQEQQETQFFAENKKTLLRKQTHQRGQLERLNYLEIVLSGHVLYEVGCQHRADQVFFRGW